MQEGQIHGGYILLARKLFDSWLMDKPPLWMKLWVWMIGQANWKDRNKLKRGQFVTTAETMREAMSYHIGARICRPSEKEIRRAYEGLTKGGMVVRTKSTRGMVITVCNYDYYQTFENYEGQREGQDEKSTKGIGGAYDTEVNRSKGSKEEDNRDKKAFGEAKKVRLSDEEYWKLIDKFGNGITEELIQRLDSYIASKGKRYKSHYHTILNWQRRDEQDAKKKKPQQRKTKIDEAYDRLDAWAGGSDGEHGVGKENDNSDTQGAHTIELEKRASGCFG